MMFVNQRRKTDAATESPDSLSVIGGRKVEAATRLTTSLQLAEAALLDLFAADAEFSAEVARRTGKSTDTSGLLQRQLSGMLLGELDTSAPTIRGLLRLTRLPKATRQTIAATVSRRVELDLAAMPQSHNEGATS